jgi:hypothetical protein
MGQCDRISKLEHLVATTKELIIFNGTPCCSNKIKYKYFLNRTPCCNDKIKYKYFKNRTPFCNDRQSRFDDFYDREDGDWGWFSTNIDEDREQGSISQKKSFRPKSLWTKFCLCVSLKTNAVMVMDIIVCFNVSKIHYNSLHLNTYEVINLHLTLCRFYL